MAQPSHRSPIHSQSDIDQDTPDHKGQVMQPLIVQPLKDYKLTEGQDAAFFCKVAGVPKPKVGFECCFAKAQPLYIFYKFLTDVQHNLFLVDVISENLFMVRLTIMDLLYNYQVTWFKNGERLKASSRFTMKYSADGYHTLRIRDTNVNDEGVYMVHAVNPGGTATSVAQLYIDTVKSIDTSSHISTQTLTQLQRRYVDFISNHPSPMTLAYVFVMGSFPLLAI